MGGTSDARVYPGWTMLRRSRFRGWLLAISYWLLAYCHCHQQNANSQRPLLLWQPDLLDQLRVALDLGPDVRGELAAARPGRNESELLQALAGVRGGERGERRLVQCVDDGL